MHINNDIGILTLVPDPWETYWMPRHHVMSRLASYYKVLWVIKPLSWRQAIRTSSPDVPSRGVKKISPSFWIYAPERYLPSLSASKFGPLHLFMNELRARKIKSLLNKMEITRLILYIWRPEFASYVGKFVEELLCYHIDDEYTFSEIESPISKRESQLLKNSDLVFIHSKTLLEKKGKLNPETYYVPNAADFDHYQKTIKAKQTQLHEFDSIPRPRIGYVGIIKNQIDLKLLLGIARQRKDWSLVMVGPINKNHKKINETIELLRRESNVYFLGGKKHEELPGYIKDLDVCLMCYRKTAYTKYIFPLKLFEYLACGKPIVAAPLENLEEFKDVLYFADNQKDWIDNIQRCLENQNTRLEQKRIAVARENSWDKRVKDIASIIQEKLD